MVMDHSASETKLDWAKVNAAIRSPFEGVSRGDGITLHQTALIDRCGSQRELKKAARLDSDRRWQDVRDSDIEAEYSALCFLDAKGFRYYIPAYMTWTLNNYAVSQSVTSDCTIYAFTHDTEDKDPRFAALNEPQKRAIALFLRYFSEVGDGWADSYMASIALKFGWDKYLQE